MGSFGRMAHFFRVPYRNASRHLVRHSSSEGGSSRSDGGASIAILFAAVRPEFIIHAPTIRILLHGVQQNISISDTRIKSRCSRLSKEGFIMVVQSQEAI